MKPSPRILASILVFALGLTLGATYALANHPWICTGNTAYHWPDTSVTLTPPVEENPAGGIGRDTNDYFNGYKDSLIVWKDTVMRFSRNDGNPDIRLFWDDYGNNGWLGLATIFINGCVITDGEAKLNDFFLANTFLYSDTNVDHVACQEVGHLFGLDHNRTANNTCMNDFDLSAGANINQHDFDQLDDIYN